MFTYLKRLVFLPFLIFSIAFAATIKGRVTDQKTGEPLVGATVEIENGSRKWHTTANLDGTYTLTQVPVGNYKIFLNYIGFAGATTYTVAIGQDAQVLTLNMVMNEASTQLTEVVVGGQANGRKLEKNADMLQNVLTQRTIQLLPDITVANALQRISGVSIQRSSSGEGRYAIIRGMDQRYNNTLINGIKIPSPDANYRYVPMDLFPSEMLERLEVIKSLTPTMEADAVGGTMNLVMKDAPQHFLLNANLGTGFNTLFSSSRPFESFSHSAVSNQSPAEIHDNNYAATQNDFSKGNLNFINHSLPFNTIAGATVGGRLLKQKLGLLLSASYQNIFRGSNSDFLLPNAQPQVIGTLDNQSVISDLWVRKYSTQTARTGLHNKIDYIFNSRNKLSLYNMYVKMDEFQSRFTYDSVYLNKLSNNLVRSRLQKQSIYASSLKGEHTLSPVFSLNWIGSYAVAKSNVPDMAEYNYQSGIVPGTFITQKLSRIWQHNTDKDLAGYLNFVITPNIKALNPQLSVGGMYRHKTRDNYYNDYSLSPVLVGGLPQQWTGFNDAAYQFSPAALGTGNISVFNTNTYTSYENVGAGYIQLKLNITSQLEFLGGTRIEHTEQGFTTVMPKSFPGREGEVSYTDMLPSAHLKYILGSKQNLRLSYFRSIVRPDFYQIIPTEVVGELFNIKGNTYLKHSIADNLDLRYELYPSGSDQFIVGAFYKNIRNPIEYAIVRNGGPSAQFLMPENFGNVRNYGLEAVFTRFVGMFGVSANYTYTHSSITTTKLYFYRDAALGITTKQVAQTRPLQGQANHIGNFSLLYKNPKIGLDVQAAFVYTGKRLSLVSPYYDLDYYQLGQGTLDFSFEQRITKHFSFYGKFNNLTNAPAMTVLPQDPAANNKLPDQKYTNKTVVGKDIYGINFLFGARFKL